MARHLTRWWYVILHVNGFAHLRIIWDWPHNKLNFLIGSTKHRLFANKQEITLGKWEYKVTVTFRETFFPGVSNLLPKKSHAVNLQTEQATTEVLSFSILATKSYLVLGIQLYFSHCLKCNSLRVHPDDNSSCSLAVCYTNVTPNLGLNHRSRRNDCKLCSARALYYFYLKFPLTNYAHFKSFTSWTVF